MGAKLLAHLEGKLPNALEADLELLGDVFVAQAFVPQLEESQFPQAELIKALCLALLVKLSEEIRKNAA